MASTQRDARSLRQSIQEESARNSGRELVQRPTNIKMPSATREQVPRDDTGFSISHNHCDDDNADARIGVPSTSKVAGMTVAPFLSKHIPDQYAPLGVTQPVQKDPNTKFCYRHAPDSKCRRTADEPTMEKLQRDLEKMTQSDQQAISHVWSLFSAAPAKHRNLMLQGILTQCCFPQLSYLASSVRDLVRIDFLNALPAEISFKVLCYLDTTSLCKASQVSQKWRLLADDDVVWHKMCEQHIDRKCTKCGWGLPILDQRRLRDDKRRQQLRATGRGLNQWSPKLTPMVDESTEMIRTTSLNSNSKRTSSPSASPESSKRQCTKGLNTDSYFVPSSKPTFRPWKDVYKDRFKVGTNWKYGRYSTKTFKGHTNGVMCLQIDDDILATGSYDTTIKIWNIETGECLRTLRGHTSGVRALQFDDGKLISASLDKTVKVWNWRTGVCVTTLGPGSAGNGAGHAQGVLSVNFDGNIVASGSVDKTIIVWNFQDKSAFSLRGHTDWVNAVKVDAASRTIFSASDDLTVRLWDLDTKQTIRTFSGHVGQVQQVVLLPMEFEPENLEVEDDDSSQPSDSPAPDEPLTFAHWPSCRPVPANYMLTGSLDNTVRLWDIHTGRCLKTFFGHVEGVWALAGDSLRAVSGAQDCVVKVWDPRTGACERTITMHEGPVTCIGLSDSTLVTGSEDSTVRVLSFKSDRGPVDEEVELATS